MVIRKLRLQRGWSQEQLAEFSGLSVRTIQRIERGQTPGQESLKSLAAVFEMDLASLRQEHDVNTESPVTITPEEEDALAYVRDVKGFYSHLISYVCVMTGLFLLNWFTSPGYFWVIWPAIGWGISLGVHALNVFEVLDFFGPEWERKQVEKRLGRKL